MPKVIITVGVPASGKTTWAYQYIAEHPGTKLSCRDDIRAEYGLTGYGDRKIEEFINEIQHTLIREYILTGSDVIVADTNIVDRFRNELIAYVKSLGAEVELKLFPITLKEALYRDANRRSPVGEDTVRRYFDMWMYMDLNRVDKYGTIEE